MLEETGMLEVAILGGTKFFGLKLANKLIDSKYRITIFSRIKNLPDELCGHDVNHCRIDLSPQENETPSHRVMRIKNVFNQYKLNIIIDNISMTEGDIDTFASALKDQKNLKQYILCSSVAVYNSWNKSYSGMSKQLLKEEDVNLSLTDYSPENTSPSFKDFYNQYVIGKRKIELEALKNFPKLGVNYTIFRPSVIEGSGDPFLRTWYWVQRLQDKKPILIPETHYPTAYKHVFVDDVANAFALAVNNPSAYNKIFNLSGDKILSVKEYLDDLADKIGIPTNSIELVEVDPDKAYEELPGFDFPPFFSDVALLSDNSALKKQLGFKPSDYDRWMKQTVDLLLEQDKNNTILPSQGYSKRESEVEFCVKMKNETKLSLF